MVSTLVIAVALGVFQLAFTLHVRNMLASSASEGARLAASHDRAIDDGIARTDELIDAGLGGYEHHTVAHATVVAGAPAIEITVTAPVPVVGLWGFGTITVHGRAFEETDRD